MNEQKVKIVDSGVWVIIVLLVWFGSYLGDISRELHAMNETACIPYPN